MASLESEFLVAVKKLLLNIPPAELVAPVEFNYYKAHLDLVNWFDTEEKVKNFLDNPTIQMLMVHNHVHQIEIDEVETADTAYVIDEVKDKGNLIHHAYSLNQFLKRASTERIKSVFEFGGGYGSFIRLLRKMGFIGPVYSYDLPFFLLLQKYFLISQKLDAGVYFLSWLEDKKPRLPVDLFIGLWSFSEASLTIRAEVLEHISFNNCLIAYQPYCNGIDNVEYFSNFRLANRHIEWTDYAVPHLKSRYLVGCKK